MFMPFGILSSSILVIKPCLYSEEVISFNFLVLLDMIYAEKLVPQPQVLFAFGLFI